MESMASGDNRAPKLKQGPNWQNPQLFSLSGGIEAGQFEQLDWVTTRWGPWAAVPALGGDPWQYYGRRQDDKPKESSTEMDTDEGQRVSQQIIDCAQEIEAKEWSKHEPIYEDPATPSFTTSTAAVADILSERSHYPPQGRPDPPPSKVGTDMMEESFEPFDFTQEFQEWHGIAPEQAPTPWNGNSRQTEYNVPLV